MPQVPREIAGRPAAAQAGGRRAPPSRRRVGARRSVLTRRTTAAQRAFHPGAIPPSVEPGIVVGIKVIGHDGRRLIAA
jgi:hypothetical protein